MGTSCTNVQCVACWGVLIVKQTEGSAQIRPVLMRFVPFLIVLIRLMEETVL